ncbi:hypothetical protein GEOBC_02576 [Geobacteraceae bacterium]|nr:hypothetical protein GEOBC_02576 [Geobacteraceae bacterium]
MRKAKDNANVPALYYRPLITTCPRCGAPLYRRCIMWRKYVITLQGRWRIFSLGYSCSRAKCTQANVIHRSLDAEQLTPKGSSFGFDLFAQVGWWRFWDHRTLDEIATLLQAKHLPVSRRQILNLIGDFLALLRAAQPAKIEAQRAYFQRHGMIISIDGMEPEQGNEMLFVVREAHLSLTLVGETLYSRRADLISRRLLEPVKALGFRIRGVISDADQNIRRAVTATLPGRPHQACQVHCLCAAGKPIFEADRALKTDLRRDIRAKLRPISRTLSQSAPDDSQRTVLVDYAEALRDVLRADGVSPFDLSGLQLYNELDRLEASLSRCQKKGGIHFWRHC